MTKDRSLSATPPRRLSGLDGAIAALTAVALALPFLSHIVSPPAPASMQIAVMGDVSAIRPIDYALGYREKQAEQAFFDGLETENPPEISETAVSELNPDMPRVQTDEAITPPQVLAPKRPVAEALDGDSTMPQPLPNVGQGADLAPPKAIKTKPESPLYRVSMSAPPSMTPVPSVKVGVARPPVRRQPIVIQEVELAALEGPFPTLTDTAEAPVPAVPKTASDSRIAVPKPRPRVSKTEIGAGKRIKLTAGAPSDSLAPLRVPIPVRLPSKVNEAPVQAALTASTPSMAISDSRVSIEAVALPKTITLKSPTQEPSSETALRPRQKGGPKIALVVAAAGLNSKVTQYAIDTLPKGITFAFAPVRDDVEMLARKAKQDGHTILVEIPMEPINRMRDPGAMTLRASDPVEKNLARLEQALEKVPNADGVSSYLGARFNAIEAAATPVLNALLRRNLFFFENEPTSRSVFQRVANRLQLPYARGVMRIDRRRDVSDIRARLAVLEKRAREEGVAIGVGSTLSGTISTVASWAEDAQKRGITFVSILDVAQ